VTVGRHRVERDWPTTMVVLALAAVGTIAVRLWVIPHLLF
jgi:hypothetical protein